MPRLLLRPPKPLFLEQETYRRRRMVDAARLLPVFGAALLLVPMVWSPERGTGRGGIYLFLVWLGIILAAAALSRHLSTPPPDPAGPGPGAGSGGRTGQD